jgi:hypothetical protein
MAVGQRTLSGQGKSLTERWNGSTWTVVFSPTPANAVEAVLQDLSCVSATNCRAVGHDAAEHSFIEHWNGTKWSIVSATYPAKSVLSGVSCASATSCMAAGGQRDGSGYKTFVMRWNGTKWSAVASPNRPGYFVDIVEGVSCVSGKSCVAAGYHIPNSMVTSTLAMRWNGTKWSLF